MTPEQWISRLETEFGSGDLVGEHLMPVLEAERAHARGVVSRFHGQMILMDSFQSFYVQTIGLALQHIKTHGFPTGTDSYTVALVHFLALFRRFRSCESLLLRGYPLDGYALLREIKDSALLLAAVALRMTSFKEVLVLEGQSLPHFMKRIYQKRKGVQQRVYGMLIRKDSGLPAGTVQELDKWWDLFHSEMHGSNLSWTLELDDWLKTCVAPSASPKLDERAIAMYINRATEIGWILLRILPYLQPHEAAFGADWARKHSVLDDSFREAEAALAQLGKPIADAFMVFMERKLKFPNGLHYYESTAGDT